MQYINQKFYVPHEVILREILHSWIYIEKLLHNCLRIEWLAELQFKTYRISVNYEILLKWNEKLQLVPTLLAGNAISLLPFFKNRQKVMSKTHFTFSDLAPRVSFLFEIEKKARIFYFHFSCYLLISTKTKKASFCP